MKKSSSIPVYTFTMAGLLIAMVSAENEKQQAPLHLPGVPAYHSALDLINSHRKDHASPPLEPNEKLATLATKHAEKLVSHPKCPLYKSQYAKEYGESVYKDPNIYPIFKSVAEVLLDAVTDWYQEILEYDFERPGFNKTSQHFTQMIWKSTKSVGIGSAENTKSNCIVIVALYYPQGNSEDNFERNVLPNIHEVHPLGDEHKIRHHKHPSIPTQ